MAIASSVSKSGPYACNGVTTAFAIGFSCQAATDVSTVRTDASGADTPLVYGTDYTVALNADQVASPGGTATLAVAPATGFQITLLRNISMTQGTSLPNQGGWYPKVVENALDKLTMIVQQLGEKVSRSVVLGVTQTDPNALIASITANAAAAATAAATATTGATTASAAAISAAASAAAALNTPAWVSGQLYTDGTAALSTTNHLQYRRVGDGSGTLDPSADPAHWAIQLIGLGLDGVQLTGNVSLVANSPAGITVTPSAPGMYAILPVATTCLKAAILFSFYNAGDYDYGIKDAAGNQLGWVRPRSGTVTGLSDNSSSAGVWTLPTAQKYGITAILNSVAAVFGVGGSITRVAIDATRTFFVFGAANIYGVVYDSSTLTWGAPTLIRAGAGISTAVLSATNQVLVATCLTTNLEVVTITVSGAGLTVNSGSKAAASTTGNMGGFSQPVAVGASWVIGYSAGAVVAYARAITVSGNAPFIGAEATLPGTGIMPPLLFVTGSIVRAVYVTSSSLYSAPYAVSGSTLTPGTAASIAQSGSSNYLRAFVNGNGNILAQFLNGSGTNSVAIFKLTGTVEAINSTVISGTIAAATTQGDYVTVSSSKTVFAFSESSGGALRLNIHVDTAGIGSVGTELTYSNTSLNNGLAAIGLVGTTARFTSNSNSYGAIQISVDCSGTSPLITAVHQLDQNVGVPAPTDSMGRRSYTSVSAGNSVYSVGSNKPFEGVFTPASAYGREGLHRYFSTGVAGAAANEIWGVGYPQITGTTICRVEACA